MLVWLSLDTWLILLLSVGYLVLLFLIAYWAQKKHQSWQNKSWIYSLSLGVSCSSWAFYGTISQAASTGEWIAPIYLGTIACFLLGWPILFKLLAVSKKQNLTSIADFIACRFDKAPQIAAVVSIIALLGTLPYIALQLRAVSHSFDIVTGSIQSGSTTTIMVTLVLIVFSILFGARNVDATKQNTGLIVAIAFSSLLKLFAITCIGLFVTYGLFDGFASIAQEAEKIVSSAPQNNGYLVATQVLLGFLTIFVTPQLYHMIVIENDSAKQLKSARWGYPLYLVLINIFVLPIAVAGLASFPGGGVNADTFMLTIPLLHQQAWLSILVYIGGLAAATSMVIVAAIVLSTLITTEIVSPILIRLRFLQQNVHAPQMSGLLLYIRRVSIAVILVLSLLFDYLFNQNSALSAIGLLSFALLAQTAPAVVAALYWRNASSKGAMWGLITGCLLWSYTLLIPTLWPQLTWLQSGPLGINWLAPVGLFGIEHLDIISHGLLTSLLGNVLVLYVHSIYTTRSVGENLQAMQFLRHSVESGDDADNKRHYHVTIGDLVDLLQRFINQEAVDKLRAMVPAGSNDNHHAPDFLVAFTQKTLASVLGSASTKLVLSAVSEEASRRAETLEQVANIVDEANQIFAFNRELLQAGVENIEQGISVVDADMRLVAWNSRYQDLLEFPDGYLKAGMPISELIEFNINRNIIQGDDNKALIEKRLQHMRQGNDHYYQRELPNGTVLEIRGQAMPGGGFVSTFSDITRHIEAEAALQQANENLEQRVVERTRELADAKAEAEAANTSKSRFLAAASHDLMQPFNALSLFNSMLQHKVKGSQLEGLANNIENALSAAETLLNDLVEISKLDSGHQKVQTSTFPLNDVLQPLAEEFSVLAQQQGIKFTYLPTRLSVHTDKNMLRRILQNFLSNAFRYAPLAQKTDPDRITKVTLGVKRLGQSLKLIVLDNGPGIAESQRTVIFKEFERLNKDQETPGLGLGLAICERIATILQAPIEVLSEVGVGTSFSVHLPKAAQMPLSEAKPNISSEQNVSSFKGIRVAIIDNDPLIVTALSQQLEMWGCDVITAANRQKLFDKVESLNALNLDILIADYHLDHDDNGLSVAESFAEHFNWHGLTVICSADPSDALRQACIDNGYGYIRKPVKGLALKRLLKSQLLERHTRQSSVINA